MSYHMEHDSENDESSQKDTEYHSESGSTKLEEGSTASEEDTFLSIWYPSPPSFPTPYLHNWDFRDSDQTLEYIMKPFNLESVHNSLKKFPDLSNDFIYSNIYIDSHQFTQLQCYINKSIHNQNAFLQRWLALHARYSTTGINPFILQCIL